MKLAAIHHVAIIVSDYEKSKDFYVNKLGFEIVRENFREERNDWKLDLRVGEGADAIELEIFAEPNPPKRVNRPEACGLRHLAFRVDDAEATVAELEQMGIGCEPIRFDSYTQKKMTFFFDPDGLCPMEWIGKAGIWKLKREKPKSATESISRLNRVRNQQKIISALQSRPHQFMTVT